MNFTVKFLCILFLAGLYCPIKIFAQTTVIKGMAPGAERKIIRIHTPGDQITFWEKQLAVSKVDSTGHFSMSVTLDETIIVTISIDFHKADMFLEPSKTYDLRISPMEYDDYTEVNPFIQSQNLTIELPGNDAHELNALIGSFNSIYSGFLMTNFNALYRDRKKVLLDTFRLQIDQHFGSEKNTYFLDYTAYKLASLEQLTQYYNQAFLAKKYFTDKPVLYNNVEYMDFFNNFFTKFITATSNTIRKIDLHVILHGPDPYKNMIKAMKTDSILKNEQLCELVMLKGLMELYNTPSYNQEEVLAVIAETKVKTKYPENRVVAEDMINLLTKLKPGTPAPEFTLLNREQKNVSLKSLRGKPVVLGFWTTYCEGCLSEMDLIKPLYDKYRENVHFVSISADHYFGKMLIFINLKRDYTWAFLHIGDQSDVLKDYDVRSYPLFVLIDKDGKINKYPAGQPSGDLESEIQKILEQ